MQAELLETTGADQKEKAELFQRLHAGPPILVLPNAWDAASARVLEAHSGCLAIGTSSAGIAAALGFADGERLSRGEMLAAVSRIARAVAVPVSADVEAGYGSTPSEAAETARGVLAAGAVGLNLEDGVPGTQAVLVEPSLQAEKIAAMREVAKRAGIPLVVNARTDVYWLQIGDAEARLSEAVTRARIYLGAGADCIFVPGVSDGGTIEVLSREIPAPLNVLATAGTPPVRELERLGVARVSVGSGFMRAALRRLQEMARELLDEGTYAAFSDDTIPYPELARLLDRLDS